MRESNSRQRFWRPLSYHLTNPLYINIMRVFTLIYYIHLSFVFQVFFFCTFKTSHRSYKPNLTFEKWSSRFLLSELPKAGHFENFVFSVPFEIKSSARSRTASVNKFTSSLLSLPDRLSFLFGQALDRLVAVRFMCCHTSTPVLST